MSGVLQPPVRPAVRLWRIEHPADGLGPFWNYNPYLAGRPRRESVRYGAEWDDVHPQQMPGPYQEAPRRMGDVDFVFLDDQKTPHLRFAFPNPLTIRRWFSGDCIRRLTAYGYVLRVLGVAWTGHRRYPSQAVYDSRGAVVLETLPPTALFWL